MMHPLKQLREDHALTVEDIAEVAGVSKGTVYNWETYRQVPYIPIRKKILTWAKKEGYISPECKASDLFINIRKDN